MAIRSLLAGMRYRICGGQGVRPRAMNLRVCGSSRSWQWLAVVAVPCPPRSASFLSLVTGSVTRRDVVGVDGLEFNQRDGSGELRGGVEREPCPMLGDFIGDRGSVFCV